MDPKHVLIALGVRYLEESGGRLRLAPAFLREAYAEFSQKNVVVLINDRDSEIVVYHKEG